MAVEVNYCYTVHEPNVVFTKNPKSSRARTVLSLVGEETLTLSQKVVKAARALADKAWAWDDDALCSCLHTSGCGVKFSEIHTEWEDVVGLAKRMAGVP